MGFLDSIENLAKRTYNYIVGDNDSNSAKSSSTKKTGATAKQPVKPQQPAKKVPNSVVNPNNDVKAPVGDVVIVKNTNTTKSSYKSAKKDPVKAKFNKLLEKANKYKISKEEVEKVILPSLGFSYAEYSKKNDKEKLIILNAIEMSLDNYYLKKNKNNPEINMAEVVGDIARCRINIAKLQFGKNNEIIKLADTAVENINNGLKSASNNKEKIEIIYNNSANVYSALENKKLEELKTCKNDTEAEKINKKFEKINASISEYIQAQVISIIGNPDEAYLLLYASGENNVVDSTQRAINSFKNKPRAAKSMAENNKMFDFVAFRHNHERAISSKEFGGMSKVLSANLEHEDLVKFHNNNVALRQDYEKHPDVYKFLTEDYFTELTKGVGLGASFNENLSLEEKAEFLYIWDQDAQKFSDYDLVRKGYDEGIKQYLEEHPEAKQGIEDLKTRYREEYGNPDLPGAAQKRYNSSRESEAIYNKEVQRIIQQPINNQNNNDNKVTNDKEDTNKTQSVKSNDKSSKDVAKALKSGEFTITDAINEYHELAFDAIFEDPELFNKNKTIAKLHINNYRKDLNKLLQLSNFSGAIELIVQNISPAIKDEYASEIKLSGITKKAIFGPDEKNAAA